MFCMMSSQTNQFLLQFFRFSIVFATTTTTKIVLSLWHSFHLVNGNKIIIFKFIAFASANESPTKSKNVLNSAKGNHVYCDEMRADTMVTNRTPNQTRQPNQKKNGNLYWDRKMKWTLFAWQICDNGISRAHSSNPMNNIETMRIGKCVNKRSKQLL